MNHGQWIKLLPEEQRMVVAELCGWTSVKQRNKDDEPLGKPPNTTGEYPVIPDYLNDLNDMYEAEWKMTEKQREEYNKKLWKICAGSETLTISARAAQRAEAFILTMTKLKEQK